MRNSQDITPRRLGLLHEDSAGEFFLLIVSL